VTVTSAKSMFLHYESFWLCVVVQFSCFLYINFGREDSVLDYMR